MKVTRVFIHPTKWYEIDIIALGKTKTLIAPTIEEVAKKAMKEENYFTRDPEIVEDIKRVLKEQEQGLRSNPNQAQVAA